MAKRQAEQPREITRKETRIRRRDAERNRRIVIGLIAASALLILIIGAGVVQELILKPNSPVATVNDARVTTRDFQKQVRYAWFQQGEVADPENTSQEVLDEMIDAALLREQAAQRDIAVAADEVTERIEQLFGYARHTPTPAPTQTPAPTATTDPDATPAPTATSGPTATPAPTATPLSLESYQEAYAAFLARLKQGAGMSEADFRSLIEGDLLRERLEEAIAADVPAEVEQVRVSHILVAVRTPAPTPTPLPTGLPTAEPAATPTSGPTPTPTPEPRDEAAALALAADLRGQLAAGTDFAELARLYSDDASTAELGGDLGWIPRDSGLVAEFEEAAFALEAGELSEPVKTQFGYHLIRVEERDPARPLESYLYDWRKSQAFQEWLTNLRDTAEIVRSWALEKVPPTPAGALR